MLVGRVELPVVAGRDCNTQHNPAFYVAIVYPPHMLYMLCQHTRLRNTCVYYSLVCSQQPVAYYFLELINDYVSTCYDFWLHDAYML